jgi:hypothetical protein
MDSTPSKNPLHEHSHSQSYAKRTPSSRELETETTRISANGTPNLSTSVVVPGGYHVQSLSQRFQNPYRKAKTMSRVQHLFYYINQSTSLRHMPGTSPSGLNQTEIKRLAAAPWKRGKLYIRRQLKCRKSSVHPAVVVEVVVRLCVRVTRVYPISG